MKAISRSSKLSGDINIPGSKSHTIRAIAIATMANGRSVLHEALDSADTRSAIHASQVFGAKVEVTGNTIYIDGIGKSGIPKNALIDVGNSGTTLRIFTALAALNSEPVKFDGDKSIRQRPMTPLFTALRKLGVKIDAKDDKCPFTITGPVKGGKTSVNGISSQFVTALLFASVLADEDIEIEVENLHEKPYVSITLDWLNKQNIVYKSRGLDWFKVRGKQNYSSFSGRIAADFSSATFALCAAAVTKSGILVKGLDFQDHQGDKHIFEHVKRMGMAVDHKEDGVLIHGGDLQGIEIDMNDTPDALPAMAVIACFAKGTTKLLNVAQARLKECDRIAAVAAELGKMGANIEELSDGLIVEGSRLKGCKVHGYHDHRMVMSLLLAGLGAEGETIVDTAEAIAVTYPSFIEDYKKLGANITTED